LDESEFLVYHIDDGKSWMEYGSNLDEVLGEYPEYDVLYVASVVISSETFESGEYDLKKFRRSVSTVEIIHSLQRIFVTLLYREEE